MHETHFIGFASISLLLFCGAASAKGSVGLEADAAKNYLSVQLSSDMDAGSGSLSLTYDNVSSGTPDKRVRSWDAELGYSEQGKIFDGSLSGSFGSDDQTRKSLGGKLSLGATWEYIEGFEASLELSGGPTRYSASEAVTTTGGILQKRSVTVRNSEGITQWSPSATLDLLFFDGLFKTWASGTRYRYQDYTQGSGLAGSPEASAAAANLRNGLESGFIDWEWSIGAKIRPVAFLSLKGIYTEALNQDSGAWSKSLEGDLSADFGKHLNALLGLVHATEGGSGDNTVKAGLDYFF